MRRTIATLFVAFALPALPLCAMDTDTTLLARAWPYQSQPRLSEVGIGVGIVFSPDLSVPGNCLFYQSLGFACFDDADWSRVLRAVDEYNRAHADHPIRTLLLETHGTNGNGLKLQRSYDPRAERSYIAVGALQEHVEPAGIRHIVISACNSGRLMRPMIYTALDPDPGDRLFLPPTCGITNATAEFDPARTSVVVLTPVSSHIETSLVGSVRELAPVTRRAIAAAAKQRGIHAPKSFAVSDMLIQIVLRDQRLQLTTGSHVDQLSGAVQPASISEGLFDSFVAWLNSVAASEQRPLKTASQRARSAP